MTTKERYQQHIDAAYQFAPFKLLAVIDLKDSHNRFDFPYCQVCGNKRIRYLCNCTDKKGVIWYIGRDCYTELYNRQLENQHHGNT